MSVKKRKWREDLARTLRAWGIYRGCRPAFFWSVGLSSLGKAVSPYVTVWFTARLVSELAGGTLWPFAGTRWRCCSPRRR